MTSTDPEYVRQLQNANAGLSMQLETARQELKNVYRERAHLVALLAALYPASLSYSDPDTPGWPVVTVLTRSQEQLSWHIAPEDVDLFGHLDPNAPAFVWDGHSTDEKYERLRRETQSTAMARHSVMASFAAEDDAKTPQDDAEAPQPRRGPGRPRKSAQSRKEG